MPSAEDLAHRYSVVSGQPLAHWDFQMALGYFKLGIIVAGIDFRRRVTADQQREPRVAAGGGQESDDAGDLLVQAVAVLISGGLAALN